MKTPTMEKSLVLLNQDFQSSSERTPQYLEFHRTFKRELKNVLAQFCSRIEISKPNHFDVSGFFQIHSGEIFWFRLGDLRWDKNDILIRSAKDFKDYSGGSNSFIKLDERFVERLKEYLKIPAIKWSFTEVEVL